MKQTEWMMKEWLKHRKVLEELLELIDDQQMHFKPWEGAISLGQLALHVSYWSDVFATMVKTGKGMEEYMGAEPSLTEYKTMEDVRKAVHDLTIKTRATYESLTDEDLEKENNSSHPKLQGKRKVFLNLLHDHEIHHKGQLFVYARMVGVKDVPFFY